MSATSVTYVDGTTGRITMAKTMMGRAALLCLGVIWRRHGYKAVDVKITPMREANVAPADPRECVCANVPADIDAHTIAQAIDNLPGWCALAPQDGSKLYVWPC